MDVFFLCDLISWRFFKNLSWWEIVDCNKFSFFVILFIVCLFWDNKWRILILVGLESVLNVCVIRNKVFLLRLVVWFVFLNLVICIIFFYL